MSQAKRTKPIRLSFISRAGKQVRIKFTKRITKPVKISFLARADKKRRK